MTTKRILIAVAAVVVLVGGYLSWEVFEFQTLFIDDKVDEERPAFAAEDGAPPPDETADAAAPADDSNTSGTVARGNFGDRSHPTEGTALVLADGQGRRVLRFEGFKTDNGPDLNVYLSPESPDAAASVFDDDYVDLGDLKGNLGDQNYEIPQDVDLDRYSTVVIWCVRFSVAFGTAGLA